MPDDMVAWASAWEDAAFGAHGFYHRHAPADHFSTDVMDGNAVVRRLAALSAPVLERLVNEHDVVTVTDAGSSDGVLLHRMAQLVGPALAERVVWRAVDLRARPPEVPDWMTWVQADVREFAQDSVPGPGILIAHELLDDLPCDVVEIDDDGERRIVLVDPASGAEELGPRTDDVAALQRLDVRADVDAWCDRWWDRRLPAARIEVGSRRDELWHALSDTVSEGLAVAVDYGHLADERATGLWDGGTLSAFRDGRAVSVVADGSCNITAHVSMDACASAVTRGGRRLERSPEGLWWLVHEMGR